MERIHAAIGKGSLDAPTIPGSDGRGVKNPTGAWHLTCYQNGTGRLSRDHHVDAPPSRAGSDRRDTQLPPGPVPHQLIRERQREAVEISQRCKGALNRGYRLGVRLVVQTPRRIW